MIAQEYSTYTANSERMLRDVKLRARHALRNYITGRGPWHPLGGICRGCRARFIAPHKESETRFRFRT